MKHLNMFTIERFRGIQDLRLENLGQINLFIGDNNSGKTSVLEALSIYSDPLNGRKWQEVSSLREVLTSVSPTTRMQRLNLVDRLTWLFPQSENHGNNKSSEIRLAALDFKPLQHMAANYAKFLIPMPARQQYLITEGKGKSEEMEVMQIDVSITSSPEQPSLFDLPEVRQEMLLFPEQRFLPSDVKSKRAVLAAQLISPFSHRLSSLQPQLWTRVVEANLKDPTLELLRSYDQRIQDIDLIFPDERQLFLSVKHQQLGRAPLSTFGDGLRRIFTLATAIPRCRNGMLLVDELEIAIHTKALKRTFLWLINSCLQHNVQLFATTHSLEAIDALLDACKSDAIDLAAYRLEQGEDQTGVTRFDKDLITRLREDLGLEVR